MPSATSFSKTLLRSDWRRLWPIFFFYTLLWFFLLPVGLWNRGHVNFNFSVPLSVVLSNEVYRLLPTTAILGALFALMLAMGLFSYLMKSNSVGLMHALPVRRSRQFYTHFLAGFSMMTLSHLLIFGLAMVMQGGSCTKALLFWLLSAELSVFFFLAFAALCCMATGWLLAVPVIFFGLNFAYLAYEMLLQVMGAIFFFGATGYVDFSRTALWFTPFVKMASDLAPLNSYEETIEYSVCSMNPIGVRTLLIYTAAGIVMLLAACLLYRLRHSESAGDAIVFPWLKPIVRYVISVAGGLGLGLLVYEVLGWHTKNYPLLLACQIVMGFIVYCGVEMLLRKTYRIFDKRTWAGLALLVAILTALLLCIRFDVTGFQRRLPDLEEVEDVQVYDYAADYTFAADPESFQALLDLHETIIAAGPISDTTEAVTSNISITYSMKDGTTLRRSYEVLPENEQILHALNAFLQQPEVAEQRLLYGTASSLGTRFTGGYLQNWERDSMMQLTPQDCTRLYEALMYDSLHADIGPEDYTGPCHMDLVLNTVNGDYSLKTLHHKCTETIQVLIDLGFAERAEDLFYAAEPQIPDAVYEDNFAQTAELIA